MSTTSIDVLAVDDEVPALDELCYLLRRCPSVGRSAGAPSATEALRLLQQDRFDVVLLDIRMPGLDGMELARVLGRFAEPPAVVFVSAHEEYAVAAFDVNAAGYLLKPVSQDRLQTVLGRICADAGVGAGGVDPLDHLVVDLSGRTILVGRGEVAWVESAGDYVRLHLRAGGSHLVRVSLALLEQRWGPHGFVRIHRGSLVALQDVRELRTDGSQTIARVGAIELPVSRRHLRDLRDRLVHHGARPRR